MSTTVLNVIGGIAAVLATAGCLPRAAAHLVKACIPLIAALTELRKAITDTTVMPRRNQPTHARDGDAF